VERVERRKRRGQVAVRIRDYSETPHLGESTTARGTP
jgi:hypothetical protein